MSVIDLSPDLAEVIADLEIEFSTLSVLGGRVGHLTVRAEGNPTEDVSDIASSINCGCSCGDEISDPSILC